MAGNALGHRQGFWLPFRNDTLTHPDWRIRASVRVFFVRRVKTNFDMEAVMRTASSCPQCAELQQAHDLVLEQYISLIELQARYFRRGYAKAGKDMDGQIRLAKVRREAALDDLLGHSGSHKMLPIVLERIDPSREQSYTEGVS